LSPTPDRWLSEFGTFIDVYIICIGHPKHQQLAYYLKLSETTNGRQPLHQLDLTTPGSLPWEANTRKQIRHTPNFLKYPLGRPQTGHLL